MPDGGAPAPVAIANAPTTNPPTITFYHTDVLGSVRALTDASGATLSRLDYLAFGETTAPLTGDPPNTLGAEMDPETAFDYLGARYYRNVWGRFTSADPVMTSAALTNPQLWNRYVYALNSPLRFSDPTGMEVSEVDEPQMADYGVTGFSPEEFMAWANGYVAANSKYGSQGRSSRIPTEPPPTSPEHQEGEIPLHLTPDFIAASKTAWENAFLGTVDTEIVVWVIRDPVSARIRYDIQKSTNERLKATSTRPDGAIAQIHTHPNIGLPPGTLGDLDKNKPDIFGVPIYILSNKGSYVSGVGSNAPQPLRPGLESLNRRNERPRGNHESIESVPPANRHDGWRAIGAVRPDNQGAFK